jgi:hypothetical protein
MIVSMIVDYQPGSLSSWLLCSSSRIDPSENLPVVSLDVLDDDVSARSGRPHTGGFAVTARSVEFTKVLIARQEPHQSLHSQKALYLTYLCVEPVDSDCAYSIVLNDLVIGTLGSTP